MRDKVYECTGTQSESNQDDMKSYEVKGTRYNVILCNIGVVGKI